MLNAPYLSPQEFADTFVTVDLNRYVPTGTQASDSASLLSILRSASSMADQWCKQILRATVDSDMESMYPSKYGDIRIWPTYRPIISLSSLEYRLRTDTDWITVTDLTDTGGLHLFERYFVYDGASLCQTDKVIVKYSYVNGFPVMDVSGTVAQGVSTITTKQTPTGVEQGTILTLVDGINSEDVTVQSISGNVITLSSPVVNDHSTSVGLTLSGIPDAIKTATGIIAANLIQRGTDGATTVHDADFETEYQSPSVITADAQTLLAAYRINR